MAPHRLDPIHTHDGVELSVRAIEPSDREGLAHHFAALSPETRYRRFLGPKASLGETELTHLTVLDHHGSEALIAVDAAGELVAVARYFELADRPGFAEVAVTVSDEWQHRGIGTALLSRLIHRAEDEGIETFTASCFSTNQDMIAVFRDLGESVRTTGAGAGTIELEISLPHHVHGAPVA